MLRFFDPQVNLSTDQGRIKEIEVTARVTGIPKTMPSALGVEKSNRRSFVAALLRMTGFLRGGIGSGPVPVSWTLYPGP
jgi:hypothetical protein